VEIRKIKIKKEAERKRKEGIPESQ